MKEKPAETHDYQQVINRPIVVYPPCTYACKDRGCAYFPQVKSAFARDEKKRLNFKWNTPGYSPRGSGVEPAGANEKIKKMGCFFRRLLTLFGGQNKQKRQ
jgi:hypothetical protein